MVLVKCGAWFLWVACYRLAGCATCFYVGWRSVVWWWLLLCARKLREITKRVAVCTIFLSLDFNA